MKKQEELSRSGRYEYEDGYEDKDEYEARYEDKDEYEAGYKGKDEYETGYKSEDECEDKYGDRFEKYLNGGLRPEKCAEIEEDIERFQVLMNHLDQTLDQELYEKEDEDAAEQDGLKKEEELGRKISKAIGRKFRVYMIAAVAAAVCLLPAFLAGLSPLLDRIFYNPNRSVEIVNEEKESAVVTNPFCTSMTVYMELFCGDKGFADIDMWPEGYGRYSIDVQTQIDGEITSHMLELVRNHLYRRDLSWNRSDFPGNAFTYKYGENSCSLEPSEAKKKLQDVPELMKIRAAVSFDKLKDMEELSEFVERHDTYYLYCPVETEGHRFWGFSPDKRGYELTESYDHEKYPYLDISQDREDLTLGDVYEKHVESMIRYLLDQEDFLEIFESSMPGGKNILNTYEYQSALEYIQKHGVKSYGTVVYATKQELLHMLEDPDVDGVYMLDGKMDLR